MQVDVGVEVTWVVTTGDVVGIIVVTGDDLTTVVNAVVGVLHDTGMKEVDDNDVGGAVVVVYGYKCA